MCGNHIHRDNQGDFNQVSPSQRICHFICSCGPSAAAYPPLQLLLRRFRRLLQHARQGPTSAPPIASPHHFSSLHPRPPPITFPPLLQHPFSWLSRAYQIESHFSVKSVPCHELTRQNPPHTQIHLCVFVCSSLCADPSDPAPHTNTSLSESRCTKISPWRQILHARVSSSDTPPPPVGL